jgi:hypothetical protein
MTEHSRSDRDREILLGWNSSGAKGEETEEEKGSILLTDDARPGGGTAQRHHRRMDPGGGEEGLEVSPSRRGEGGKVAALRGR